MGVITSPTLLRRMRNVDDQEAWDEFYHLYSSLIISFCIQKNLSVDMSHDVLQESMVCLLKQMPSFTYDPRKGKFRSFLLRIVDCRIKDTIRRRKRYQSLESVNDDQVLQMLHDTNVETPCKEWDNLWEHNLLLRALDHIRKRVEPITYTSFKMYVLEQKSIAQVRRHLIDRYGKIVSRNTIYQHKNRVIELLKKELDQLKFDMGE